MSMSTDIIYGDGFKINVSNEMLCKFFELHADTLKKTSYGEEFLNALATTDNISNVFEYFNDVSGFGGIDVKSIVANIMYLETNIGFEYHMGTEEVVGVIMLCETVPWNYNETEKALTADSLKDICIKYMAELGISESDYETNLSIEYFG